MSSKFQVPGGVLCKLGEQSSGRLLQFAGQGGAEEWLGLGQNLKDSNLHDVPAGASGWARLHGERSGFSVLAGGVRGYPTPGVSRESEVSGRYLAGRIFLSALGS